MQNIDSGSVDNERCTEYSLSVLGKRVGDEPFLIILRRHMKDVPLTIYHS